MSDLWIPASARGATEVAPGVEVKAVDSESLDRMLTPDHLMFVPIDELGDWALDNDAHGRTSVPAARVNRCERLRQQVIDGTVTVELHGVCAGLATATGEVVPFPDGPQLYLRTDDLHYYFGPLTDDRWLGEVLGGAGFALIFEPLPDGRPPYIVTGPINRFPGEGMIVAPSSRASQHPPRVGRNQPCPCDSGLKFKRCCGA